MTSPAVRLMTWPVMSSATEEQSMRVSRATSSSVTVRPNAVAAVISARTSAGVRPLPSAMVAITRSSRGLSTPNGEIVLTLMLSGPSSWARGRVRPTTPSLAAGEGGGVGGAGGRRPLAGGGADVDDLPVVSGPQIRDGGAAGQEHPGQVDRDRLVP